MICCCATVEYVNEGTRGFSAADIVGRARCGHVEHVDCTTFQQSDENNDIWLGRSRLDIAAGCGAGCSTPLIGDLVEPMIYVNSARYRQHVNNETMHDT